MTYKFSPIFGLLLMCDVGFFASESMWDRVVRLPDDKHGSFRYGDCTLIFTVFIILDLTPVAIVFLTSKLVFLLFVVAPTSVVSLKPIVT